MLIEGLKTEKVEVRVDPTKVVDEIGRKYMEQLGLPAGTYMEFGAWVYDVDIGHRYQEKKTVRVASEYEQMVWDAIKMTRSISTQL